MGGVLFALRIVPWCFAPTARESRADRMSKRGSKVERLERTLVIRNVTRLFKPYFVRRQNGNCQVLFALTELDDLIKRIVDISFVEGFLLGHLTAMRNVGGALVPQPTRRRMQPRTNRSRRA